MSAKKGAPALYELYHSGKSPRKGILRKKSKVSYAKISDALKENPRDVAVNKGQTYSAPTADASVDNGDDSCFLFDRGRVKLDFSIWIFILIIAALGMSMLAAYQLGQTAVIKQINKQPEQTEETTVAETENTAKNGNTTPPSDEMQAALESETYSGLITGKVIKNNNLDTAGQSVSSEVERPARCLIVYGHNNPDDLKVVKDFFDSNGLVLDIAKRGREYVLITRKGFNSSTEPAYQNLKEKIYSIGEQYIVNRPDGGIRINLTTFKSSYAIDTSKLEFDIN